MNDKAKFLYKVVNAAAECCSMEIDDEGTTSITAEDVLSKNRHENVAMTRCVCVMVLLSSGYSVTTIAKLFDRTPHAIRHIIGKSRSYYDTSRAFRIAHAETVQRCKELMDA